MNSGTVQHRAEKKEVVKMRIKNSDEKKMKEVSTEKKFHEVEC